MIDWKKSAELNSCSIDDLKDRFDRFPKSNKRIIAICDECGKEREIYNHAYHELCRSCGNGMHDADVVKRVQESRKKLPNLVNNISIGLKKYHKNHPYAAVEISVRTKEYRRAHPERWDTDAVKKSVANLTVVAARLWDDPSHRERMSDRMKDLWADTNTYYSDACIMARDSETLSARAKEWHEAHPEWKIEHSAKMQGISTEDWAGFTDKSRPHIVPKQQCIHLNPIFDGCNQHHITSGVIINIPCDMHTSVYHMMPTSSRDGKNMEIINGLAFEYLLSGGIQKL